MKQLVSAPSDFCKEWFLQQVTNEFAIRVILALSNERLGNK